MSYVIRNIRPSVIHIPDAGVRLESGQTAIVDALSPQMQELLANRALEAISSDLDTPAAPAPVEDTSSAASAVTEPVAPVVAEKKTRKSGTTVTPETSDDAQ